MCKWKEVKGKQDKINGLIVKQKTTWTRDLKIYNSLPWIIFSFNWLVIIWRARRGKGVRLKFDVQGQGGERILDVQYLIQILRPIPLPHYQWCLQVSETVCWHKFRWCYSTNMLQHWVEGRDLIYFWKVAHSRFSINFSRNWLCFNNLCEILSQSLKKLSK